MKRLEKVWITFRNSVLPKGASEIQEREMKKAFYAGAWALFCIIMVTLSPEEEPKDEDVDLMKELEKEMRDFALDVKKGRA